MTRKRGDYNKFLVDLTPESIHKLALLGATADQVCSFFGISTTQLDWRLANDEGFSKAYREGAMIADGRVAASLYKRALGYTYDEVKTSTGKEPGETITTKHIPPDTAACIFWLTNRQRDAWRQSYSVNDKVRQELQDRIEQELGKMRETDLPIGPSNGGNGQKATTRH